MVWQLVPDKLLLLRCDLLVTEIVRDCNIRVRESEQHTSYKLPNGCAALSHVNLAFEFKVFVCL